MLYALYCVCAERAVCVVLDVHSCAGARNTYRCARVNSTPAVHLLAVAHTPQNYGNDHLINDTATLDTVT